MRINELSPAPNSKAKAKRLGRGIGSGLGKTAGKGYKGQGARSGGGVKPGFEGGQMNIIRRLPKVGFNNKFRKEYSIANVDALNKFEDGTVITAELLKQNNIIGKIEKDGLKILGNGTLQKNLIVRANKFTATAIEKIKQAGGTIEVL